MKNIVIGILIVLVLVAGWFFFSRDAEALVGESVLVSTFTSGGEPTGKVLVQVPFLRTLEERRSVSVAIDINEDGAFSAEEYLIRDVPTLPGRLAYRLL